MTRRFYRTVVQIEILSEEPFGNPEDLENVHYAITEGDCSGSVTILAQEQVDAARMAKLLEAQGSDAGFFRLDSEGNEQPMSEPELS